MRLPPLRSEHADAHPTLLCSGSQVHIADNRVLLYPLGGLSAAAFVGAFAVGIHRLSEPPKRA